MAKPVAGSRMHVLDWLDGGDFVSSINRMLHGTDFLVPASGKRMPTGWDCPQEARLGKECRGLLETDRNQRLLEWWLATTPGANVPNWDLACTALYGGDRPALVLVEAKAHVPEFDAGEKGKKPGNRENDERIWEAISEACRALAGHADGVGISRDSWYQFSNRVAFAWKLASTGIPTALIYLGFTGDSGMEKIGPPLRNDAHWRDTVVEKLRVRNVFPVTLWEREIDCGAAPLWLLVRSRACMRQSHLCTSLEGFAVDDDGLPTDDGVWDDVVDAPSPFDFDYAEGPDRSAER